MKDLGTELTVYTAALLGGVATMSYGVQILEPRSEGYLTVVGIAVVIASAYAVEAVGRHLMRAVKSTRDSEVVNEEAMPAQK